MIFLKKLRKFVGYIVVLISLFIGIIGVYETELDAIILNFFIYILIGGFPFIIGMLLIEGWRPLKENAWARFRLYTGVTIPAPAVIRINDYFNTQKEERVSSPTDIYLDYVGTPQFLTYAVIGAGILAFMTFVAIYVTWFQMEKHVYIMFVVSLIICIVVPIIAKNDYRAIREEGLFLSSQGSNKAIPWSDIEKVELDGEIVEGLGRSSSSYYKWDFIFYLEDGEKEKFGPFSYSDYNLQDSKDIKNIIMENRVSISIDELSEEEWSYVKIDMEYEEGDPNDFYSLFQYNPEEKEYYFIPYE